jgi:putative endonuclease
MGGGGTINRALCEGWGRHCPKTCHSERSRRARDAQPKNPDTASCDHAATGSSTETPVLTFSAVRDGFYYKFWVYILVSRTGTLYIGITGYFDRRIRQHKMDSIEGFTSKYKIHRLVYFETYDHARMAINREKQLKGWRREKKIGLIEKINPRWQDLAENWGREMRFRGQSLEKTP